MNCNFYKVHYQILGILYADKRVHCIFELHNTSGCLYTNAFLNLFKGFEMWLAKNGRRKWKRKEKWRSMYRGREKGS